MLKRFPMNNEMLAPIQNRFNRLKGYLRDFYPQKDKLWLVIWLFGLLILGLWDGAFLNAPARRSILHGFFNTMVISSLVILIATLIAWLATVSLEALSRMRNSAAFLTINFLMNLVRSVPQIIGVLFGYIWITGLIDRGTVGNPAVIMALMAIFISVFTFYEMVDLMEERIEHYKKLDFYSAMLVCGISHRRIINFDILWKNSRIHILNKMIALFGVAVFLQCSVDFIISVGLSTDVSSVNLPATLGSLLAKIDSKQDILAIGYSLTKWSYIPNIFFKHLQGVSVAFLIVFTLFSFYKISNGYAERHRL